MNQPTSIRRRPPQMSLAFMLLMMVIFAMISAGWLYALQVGEVRDEISVLLGGKAGSSDDVGRLAHIVFIMFTFTSPLLLAATLSTGMAILRWFKRQR